MNVSKINLSLDLVGGATTPPKYTLRLDNRVVDGDPTDEKVAFLQDVLQKASSAFPGRTINVDPPGTSFGMAAGGAGGGESFVAMRTVDSDEASDQEGSLAAEVRRLREEVGRLRARVEDLATAKQVA